MTHPKPAIEREQILELLKEHFGEPVQALEPVQGGHVAQTMSFRVGQQEYILRINPRGLGATFWKEAFIFQHFASPAIPIPPMVKVGQLGDRVYAISRKMPGRSLQALSPVEYEELLPDLVRTLYAIHTADVSCWQGCGVFDDAGRGMAESWRSHLAAVIEEEPEGGFFGKWHALFETTFLEREFFDKIYQYMLRQLAFCHEERYLVHGDFGFSNLLAEGGKVTAVLDWLNAAYGDFVYDIAWLDFWQGAAGYPGLFQRYYTAQGLPLLHYTERLNGCKAYIGLNAMRFYAHTGSQEAYGFTRRILQALVEE